MITYDLAGQHQDKDSEDNEGPFTAGEERSSLMQLNIELSRMFKDKTASEGYTYCGEELSCIKKESCADGDAEDAEPLLAYLQDER